MKDIIIAVRLPNLRRLLIKKSKRHIDITREIIMKCGQSLESITINGVKNSMMAQYMDTIIGSGAKLKELHIQRAKLSSHDMKRLS